MAWRMWNWMKNTHIQCGKMTNWFNCNYTYSLKTHACLLDVNLNQLLRQQSRMDISASENQQQPVRILKTKKQTKLLCLPMSACLCLWLTQRETQTEWNLICLLSGPRASWPMTLHLQAVILPWFGPSSITLPLSTRSGTQLPRTGTQLP